MAWVATANSLASWILWIIFAGLVIQMVRARLAKLEQSQ